MKHAVKHIHFVGIGGSGMSGIAEVLLTLGYTVSGSDAASNATTRRLMQLGAKVAHETDICRFTEPQTHAAFVSLSDQVFDGVRPTVAQRQRGEQREPSAGTG